MVKFISKLGGLFGKDPKKPAGKPVKTDPKPKKAKKSPSSKTKTSKPKPAKVKPASSAKFSKPAAAKAIKPIAAKPVPLPKPRSGKELKTVVLFTMPNCADCEEARKLLSVVRRVVRNVVFQEVDLSTKEGELEGLLNGIVKAPAFVINGRPVFRGVLPSREQLARVINEVPSQ